MMKKDDNILALREQHSTLWISVAAEKEKTML